MKMFALAALLVLALGLVAHADNDKIDLSGQYSVVSGMKEGMPIDEKAKKVKYSATTDTFVVEGKGVKFVYSYKLKPGTTPVEIDMAVAEGPLGTKGALAVGIIEVKGNTLKLAYSLDKEKRPKDFAGKTGYYIELKKTK